MNVLDIMKVANTGLACSVSEMARERIVYETAAFIRSLTLLSESDPRKSLGIPRTFNADLRTLYLLSLTIAKLRALGVQSLLGLKSLIALMLGSAPSASV